MNVETAEKIVLVSGKINKLLVANDVKLGHAIVCLSIATHSVASKCKYETEALNRFWEMYERLSNQGRGGIVSTITDP
jgi:hypothetical protein